MIKNKLREGPGTDTDAGGGERGGASIVKDGVGVESIDRRGGGRELGDVTARSLSGFTVEVDVEGAKAARREGVEGCNMRAAC